MTPEADTAAALEYVIAPADLDDVAGLGAIEEAAAGIFSPRVLPVCLRKITLPLNMLEDGVKNGSLWVARVAGSRRIAGYLLARYADEASRFEGKKPGKTRQGHIAQVDVLPEFMRRGIGTALVTRAVHWAEETGLSELWLTTFGHIAWNAPFYAKLGFEVAEPAHQPAWIKQILLREKQIALEGRVAMVLNSAGHSLRPGSGRPGYYPGR